MDLNKFINSIDTDSLAFLNMEIIKYISFRIKLNCIFNEVDNILSFSLNDDRNSKLLKILEQANASSYLCGATGYTYIKKHEFISKNINPLILIQKDSLPINFSIVDLISKIGFLSCKSYIEEKFSTTNYN